MSASDYSSRPEHDARRVFSMTRREKLRTCGMQPHYGWLEHGTDEYEIKEIAQALADNVNPTLFKIDFFKARLGDEGMTLLSVGLRSNTALLELDLSMNGIGDAGAASIARFLQVC